MDLWVVPNVCTETLPTVELVRRADYPQSVGSVLPRDSRLGSACTMEVSLSH